MTVALGTFEISARQKELVNIALDASRTSNGPFTQRFEQLLAEMHDVKHGIFMASGTCALQVILLAAKELYQWRDGDEVIVPATTFIATVMAVRQAGLKPVLCDVELETGNIDVHEIGVNITKRTRAILPVHLLGRACDMTNLAGLADDFGLKVFEDACEAIGVEQFGKPVCSFGVGGAISTYVCHHISTGVGGMVLTNDDDIATICRSLMVHGRDPAYLKLEDDDGLENEKLRGMMSRRYLFVREGYSYRATEMEAALGVGELEDLSARFCGTDKLNARRIGRGIAERRWTVADSIRCALGPLSRHVSPQDWPNGCSPLFYPLLCDSPQTCERLSVAFELAGIETRPLMPLLAQPMVLKLLKEQRRSPDQYPVACDLMSRAFLIGCHHKITQEDVGEIKETAEEALR